MKITYRKALPEEAAEIFGLYTSLIGTPGCTWDESYPEFDMVQADADSGRLYCAVSEGRIVAAGGYGEPEPELLTTGYDFGENPIALARIGVRREFQNMGIAEGLVKTILRVVAEQGYALICLMAGKYNPAARHLYTKLGFFEVGEARLFETDWICMKKQIYK